MQGGYNNNYQPSYQTGPPPGQYYGDSPFTPGGFDLNKFLFFGGIGYSIYLFVVSGVGISGAVEEFEAIITPVNEEPKLIVDFYSETPLENNNVYYAIINDAVWTIIFALFNLLIMLQYKKLLFYMPFMRDRRAQAILHFWCGLLAIGLAGDLGMVAAIIGGVLVAASLYKHYEKKDPYAAAMNGSSSGFNPGYAAGPAGGDWSSSPGSWETEDRVNGPGGRGGRGRGRGRGRGGRGGF